MTRQNSKTQPTADTSTTKTPNQRLFVGFGLGMILVSALDIAEGRWAIAGAFISLGATMIMVGYQWYTKNTWHKIAFYSTFFIMFALFIYSEYII